MKKSAKTIGPDQNSRKQMSSARDTPLHTEKEGHGTQRGLIESAEMHTKLKLKLQRRYIILYYLLYLLSLNI